jgi:hypothetical protein
MERSSARAARSSASFSLASNRIPITSFRIALFIWGNRQHTSTSLLTFLYATLKFQTVKRNSKHRDSKPRRSRCRQGGGSPPNLDCSPTPNCQWVTQMPLFQVICRETVRKTVYVDRVYELDAEDAASAAEAIRKSQGDAGTLVDEQMQNTCSSDRVLHVYDENGEAFV